MTKEPDNIGYLSPSPHETGMHRTSQSVFYRETFQGNCSISGNNSFLLAPPSQRTSLSTTGSKPTFTKTPSSIPAVHPLFFLFAASSAPTPYRSPLHSPIPLLSSPATRDSGLVTSGGGLIPTTSTRDGAHPTAGKWHSRKRRRLNSCVTSVMRDG